MNQAPPSPEEMRDLLINAPHFIWPEFSAMPLNCFDIGPTLLTFPGDIARSRNDPFSDCADFSFDINDLNTCPRIDSFFEKERWNESSLTIRWFLGRTKWACSPGDIRQFSVTQGFFSVYINIKRFQNLEGINDITQPNQILSAMYQCLGERTGKSNLVDFCKEAASAKAVNGKTWTIIRSFNACNFPEYDVVLPIDYRTAIYLGVDLDNCWFDGETIPEEVEQKHLASLWDYLSHINLHPAENQDLKAGTIFREAPGQAEKADDDKFEW